MTEAAETPSMTPEQQQQLEIAKHAKSFQVGARWFYWIAGFSVINTVIHMASGSLSFIVGLGITQFIDAIVMAAKEEGFAMLGVLQAIALAVNALITGLYALFGWRALKGRDWAFIVGMTLYALDALLFLLVSDWLSLGFHVFAFVCILTGYRSLRTLRAIQATLLQQQQFQQYQQPAQYQPQPAPPEPES